MTETGQALQTPAPLDATSTASEDLQLRVAELESARAFLEAEIKNLRYLIESVIVNRQKSHSELVLLLTNLVSKVQVNEAGLIISKLLEHNNNLSQFLSALAKGTADAPIPEPDLLKTLDHTKKELLAAVAPQVQELIRLESPLDRKLLEEILVDPETFFSPYATRAWRCFVKGQVPRERIMREFGDPALPYFRDMTTDPKLNPRPKAEEIVMAFRGEAEGPIAEDAALTPEQKASLLDLCKRVQQSKSSSENAQAQRTAFQKLSFYIELLHYYEHQSTEPADVIFAQRLPALIEQLAASRDEIEETGLKQAEELLSHIINPDHRQMVINNVGKGGSTARTLKYLLTFRSVKVESPDSVATEFIRHLLPSQSQKAPAPAQLLPILQLIPPTMQRVVIRALDHTDRLRKDEAGALAKALAAELGIPNLDEGKVQEKVPPEVDREMAWERIKDMVTHRTDAATLAGAIRERLNAHYESEEIRQSWVVLTEADPMTFIRVFCQLPYLPGGKTDPIAKPVMESHLTRLLHEKYASTYNRVLTSLRNIYKAKADSPTLMTFMALVKWASPEAAAKISADVGMPAA